MEMTPREHFYLYMLLHQFDPDFAEELGNYLLSALRLTEFANKPVRELSGGSQRKLAVALAFFSPSSIILLDEPTSSLDPVARRCVHELILSYRMRKTFMLCTHLLSEAEVLSDVISIMIKGCVYTHGTPQYLSQKFGTEFKVDIMLDDDGEVSAAKCDRFFGGILPYAEMTISRPKARIYTVPASAITLPDLFERIEEGKRGDNGFCYYTCSSSSLERVFMEVVKMSETPEGDTILSRTLQMSLSERPPTARPFVLPE
jgi:ABC-type multidrug transport system ATPase subunit